MQSSNTFNLATLNCDNQNNSDSDSDNQDDTGSNTNNNNNNNNNNGNTNKKKKMVERFSCPYCRREFDVTVIDKATMKKTEWMDNTTKKKKKDISQEIIIWQYSGRKGGWWAYQKAHKKQLEKGYQKFLKQLKDEQDKEDKAQKKLKKNKNNNTKYDLSVKNKDEDEDEDDDLGAEVGLLSHECMIEIGVRKYVCDFAQMIQYDYEFPTRKRKIRRRIETKHSLEKSDSLKGCAGKFFNDKGKNKDHHDKKNGNKKNENGKNKNKKRKRRRKD